IRQNRAFSTKVGIIAVAAMDLRAWCEKMRGQPTPQLVIPSQEMTLLFRSVRKLAGNHQLELAKTLALSAPGKVRIADHEDVPVRAVVGQDELLFHSELYIVEPQPLSY